jgi:hypothetical protein
MLRVKSSREANAHVRQQPIRAIPANAPFLAAFKEEPQRSQDVKRCVHVMDAAARCVKPLRFRDHFFELFATAFRAGHDTEKTRTAK